MKLNSKQQELVKEMAQDMKPSVDKIEALVDKIEASVMTTKNHYGRYMELLSHFKDSVAKQVICLAMIECGGNAQGIRDAYKLTEGSV